MSTDYTNSFILNSLGLPIIKDIFGIADAMVVSSSMIYLLSQESSKFYKDFSIPKKDGSLRNISSPALPMKLVQKWILKNILEKIRVSDQSMAFIKGVNGCKKNAQFHHQSLYILHMDIENFFPSIKREKVFYLFKNLGYNNLVSNVFSNICTLNDSLPQGGVASPYISNLICNRFDRRLEKLCSTRDIIYTRYADDLTFSCDNLDVLRKVKNIIEDIVKDEGFNINHTKTRILSRYGKMQVNGITLNAEKLKADKKLKKRVRSQIHNMFVTGDFSKVNEVKGYIAYISSIEDDYFKKIILYIRKLCNGDFRYSKNTVDAFNDSGLFDFISKMQYQSDLDDYNEDRYYDYESCDSKFEDINLKRYNFLVKKGLINDSFEEESFTQIKEIEDLPF